MVREELNGVDLGAIEEGKANQYKFALNKLEEAVKMGDLFGFMYATKEYLEVKDEAEDYIKNKGGAFKGLEELNKYQERLYNLFNNVMHHKAWR